MDKKNQQSQPNPSTQQGTFPLSFFPDTLQNKWFKVESQVTDFQGINGCLIACQEAIQNQKIEGQGEFSAWWNDLQESIKYCQQIWNQMDAYQKEHNPNYKGSENPFSSYPQGEQKDWPGRDDK